MKFPYILPNIVGILICLAGILTTYFYIPETNPEDNASQGGPTSNVSMKAIWAKPATRDHLITYWASVFCSQFNLETLPLFFVATVGGLSLQEATIGAVLSGAGLFYGIVLYLTYFRMMRDLGLYGTMKICSLFGSNLAVLTPIAVLLNRGSAPNTLTVLTYVFLVLVQGMLRVGTGIMYTVASLGCNQSVTKQEISAMNGLSMFGASVTQAIGPIMAGFTTSFAFSSGVINPYYGAYLPFGIVSAVAVFLSVFVFTKLKKYYPDESP